MQALCHQISLSFLGVHSSSSDSDQTFKCPEEFGYYPHPEECSKYFVCVFGGPLLESCTVGLMNREVNVIYTKYIH